MHKPSTHGQGRPDGREAGEGPLLTVIVPVYNTSERLDCCLRALQDSSYRHLEVIIVDDGSTDSSPQMCDQWATRDSRFRVIHKANGGLSSARNAALDVARGLYVTFVDSDDYVTTNALGDVMRVATAHPEYDILEYGIQKRVEGDERPLLRLADREWRDMEQYWLTCQAYAHSYMWNKVFRSSLFDSVRFPEGVAFEDMHTLPSLLQRANIVATTSIGHYIYNYNPHGITATAGPQQLRQLLDAHLRVIDSYWDKPMFDLYYLHVLNIQLSVCRIAGDAPRLRHRRMALRKAPSTVLKAKAILLNILGIKRLCNIYKRLPLALVRH